MAILPWSQRIRSAGCLCVEVLPELLITGGMTTVGLTYFWPIAAAAVVPAAFALRDTYRTVSAERRYAVTKWLVAERKWQLDQQRNTAGQLEGTHRPTIVEGEVADVTVERTP